MTSNPQIFPAYNGFVTCLFPTLALLLRVILCMSHDLSVSILELRGSPQLGHATVMVKGAETLASHALALEASGHDDNVVASSFLEFIRLVMRTDPPRGRGLQKRI